MTPFARCIRARETADLRSGMTRKTGSGNMRSGQRESRQVVLGDDVLRMP